MDYIITDHGYLRILERIGDLSYEQAHTLICDMIERGRVPASGEWSRWGVIPVPWEYYVICDDVMIILARQESEIWHVKTVVRRKKPVSRERRTKLGKLRGLSVREALERFNEE